MIFTLLTNSNSNKTIVIKQIVIVEQATIRRNNKSNKLICKFQYYIRNYTNYDETWCFLFATARRWPKWTNGDPAVRRLRRSNSRKMAVAGNGSVLAQRLPQVLVLWCGTGGNRPLVLHQERHDPLQKRLQKVRVVLTSLGSSPANHSTT